GRLATRVAVDENELPNGRVDFHGKHPGPLPKEKPLKLADFYAARISTPPTLQWMVLSPPYTNLKEMKQLQGDVSALKIAPSVRVTNPQPKRRRRRAAAIPPR
ncbi:hypothetical protein, partial [Methylobacterium sp. E-045]|uniref:hypothetical protein n=1 Tax=Methylobacterium sp. E-045 TaxID=2836575 RepID=UPI001FB8C7E3